MHGLGVLISNILSASKSKVLIVWAHLWSDVLSFFVFFSTKRNYFRQNTMYTGVGNLTFEMLQHMYANLLHTYVVVLILAQAFDAFPKT